MGDRAQAVVLRRGRALPSTPPSFLRSPSRRCPGASSSLDARTRSSSRARTAPARSSRSTSRPRSTRSTIWPRSRSPSPRPRASWSSSMRGVSLSTIPRRSTSPSSACPAETRSRCASCSLIRQGSPWRPLTPTTSLGIDEAIRKIASFPRKKNAPGAEYRYSDIGFIVLGEIVRRVSGESLDVFARERIFRPLGMQETRFLPPPEEKERAALTEAREGVWMRGVVHDPRAYLLGGVSGHAGLFSTAQDLAIFAQTILRRWGARRPARPVGEGRSRDARAPRRPRGIRVRWMLDVKSAYSSNRGESLSPRAVGHGGYTGTSLWIDPDKDLFVLFLSNLHHPAAGSYQPARGQCRPRGVRDLARPERRVVRCIAASPSDRDRHARLPGLLEPARRARGAHHERDRACAHGCARRRSPQWRARRHARRGLRARARPHLDRDERIAGRGDETTACPFMRLYGAPAWS